MSTVANLAEYKARKQAERKANATCEELMIESNGLMKRHMATLENLKKYFTRTPMQLILTPDQIHKNWHKIKADPLNNNPEIESPEEYIEKAKLGLVTAGAADIVVIDKLPDHE